MRTKSRQTMIAIINFVDYFFNKENRSPSLREMEKATGFSRQTVQRYLWDLNDSGEIKYDGKRIVTPHIEELLSARVTKLPIIGHIPCGTPDAQNEYTEDYIDFPTLFLGEGEYFALYACGDSMVEAGINDGDLVIVQSKKSAESGEIVVAIDDNNQNTLKRLLHDGERYYLHPENKNYSDIYPEKLEIQGIAIKVIKELS